MANKPPRRDGEKAADHRGRVERLEARLGALWLHQQDDPNIYFALDAFNACVKEGANPPAWVLRALQTGIADHLERPTRDLSLCMGTRARGSGKTPPFARYEARHQIEKAMREMWRLCEREGVQQLKAARAVRERLSLKHQPETLAKVYRTRWRRFYRAVIGKAEIIAD